MSTFTHFDPQEISEREKEMLQFLKDNFKTEKNLNPSENAISNILYYSKALSIKKIPGMGFLETILN